MRHVLLLAAVLMGGCGESRTPAQEERLGIIATFHGHDEVSVAYALRVLDYHGIRSDAWGSSLGVSVGVDAARVEEAGSLLKTVPDLRPFVSPGTASDWPVRDWESDLVLDASIQDALEAHDAMSLPGRILRKAVSRRPRSILEGYPLVSRVKWRTREFVHKDLTRATAIEALVVFESANGGAILQEDYVSILPED